MNKRELLEWLKPFADDVIIGVRLSGREWKPLGQCEFHFDCPENACIVLSEALDDTHWSQFDFG